MWFDDATTGRPLSDRYPRRRSPLHAVQLAIALAMLSMGLAWQVEPAQACSCGGLQHPDDAIAAMLRSGDLVVLGEQIAGGTGNGADERFTLRVDRVLAGSYSGATIEVASPQDSCGGGGLGDDSGLHAIWLTERDTDIDVPQIVMGCGPPYDGWWTLAHLEGLPELTGVGPPAFVVEHEFRGSNLATISATGEVIASVARGNGSRVSQIVACPGDAVVLAATVDDDVPDLDGDIAPDAPLRIEVWGIDDLEIRRTLDTGLTARSWNPRLKPAPIDVLRCHDPEGNSVSYFARDRGWQQEGPEFVWGETASDGEIHLWQGEQRSEVAVQGARHVFVEPENGVAYLVREQSRGLSEVALDTSERTDLELPDVGNVRQVAAADGIVHVLLGPTGQVPGVEGFFPIVDTQAFGTPGSWQVAPLDLGEALNRQAAPADLGPSPDRAGRVVEIAPNGEGFTALVDSIEAMVGLISLKAGADGRLTIASELALPPFSQAESDQLAFGPRSTLLASSLYRQDDSQDWPYLSVHDHARDERRQVFGTGPTGASVALGSDHETLAAAASVASFDVPASGEHPQRSELIDSADTTASTAPDAATSNTALVVAVVAGLILTLLVGVGLVRRAASVRNAHDDS